MLVKFLQSIAGQNFSHNVNQVKDIPEHVAMPWVESGVAELVGRQKPIEAAVQPAKRTAVLPRAKRAKQRR